MSVALIQQELNPYHARHNPGQRPPNHLALGLSQEVASPAWVQKSLGHDHEQALGREPIEPRMPLAAAEQTAGACLQDNQGGGYGPGYGSGYVRGSQERSPNQVLLLIKEAFMASNGAYSLNDFGRIFRALDQDKEGHISIDGFLAGMVKYGLRLTRRELSLVWDRFRKDRQGFIRPVDFNALRRVIVGDLSQARLGMVHTLWTDLDDDCSGAIDLGEMMRYYNPNTDPSVLQRGLGYHDAVNFTFQRLDENGSGTVSEAELLHFFTDLTPHLESDDDFRRCVRSIFVRKR